MNERIRELAQEAEAYADYYAIIADELEKNIFIRRFAELIVKECEKVSLKNSHRNDDMGAIIARQISKHFGVAE